MVKMSGRVAATRHRRGRGEGEAREGEAREGEARERRGRERRGRCDSPPARERRAQDKTANEAELAHLTDMLLEEAAHLQTGAVADAPLPGPISQARSRLQQELLVLVLEKQLAETELESEQEEMVLLERVAAAGRGKEGEAELRALGKRQGANYRRRASRQAATATPAPGAAS